MASTKSKRSKVFEPISTHEFEVELKGVQSSEREDLRLGIHTKELDGEGLRITKVLKSGRLVTYNAGFSKPEDQVQAEDRIVAANGKSGNPTVIKSQIELPQARGSSLKLLIQRVQFPDRDRNILMVGGYDGTDYYETSELWQEDEDSFQEGPRLRVPRWGAGAVPLPDSMVLVAGGFDGSTYQDTTELLDARDVERMLSQGFQEGPRMATPRLGCTAVRIDQERALIIGGYAEDSTEIFDLGSRSFQPGPSMTGPRACCAAVMLDERRLLVAGGFDGAGSCDTTEVLDILAEPARDSAGFIAGGLETVKFTEGPSMTARRAGCTAVKLDARWVLVVGGTDNRSKLASTELLDLQRMEFKPGPAMTTPRSGPLVAVRSSREVVVTGGQGEQGLSSSEVLDVAKMIFSPGPPIQTKRSFGAAVAYPTWVPPDSDSESN